jgi:uncharacterized membrane protein YccC
MKAKHLINRAVNNSPLSARIQSIRNSVTTTMDLSLSTRAKEAIKTGLAMMLVYGIALNFGWMNPSWAGWAVAMCSLATIGQSLNKGLLRVAGTIPGCTMALIILSLASQSRWGFVALTSLWIFFTTYMMIIDKQRSYMWNVAGFVCLVILLTGPSSSENAFEHATFRTIETIMGVVVYTLVSVFLWPRNNAGAIRKAGINLVSAQSALIAAGRRVLEGDKPEKSLLQLRTVEVQQIGALSQALLAEGSESYEVYELRNVWDRFQGLSGNLMEAIDGWGIGLTDISKINVNAVFPGLPVLFDEFDDRFGKIQEALGGHAASYQAGQVKLEHDSHEFQGLSASDLAALTVFRKELESIERLTRSILECAQELAGNSIALEKPAPAELQHKKEKGFVLPVVDLDHLRGASFAGLTVFLGFLVFIYVNPPGHAAWFEFPAIVAMAVAATPQINAVMMGKSIGLASLLCLGVYVFIMPSLTSFLGLGSLLFFLVFINCYFFTGLARLAGMIAIINEISVQNQQSYNFAAMANSLLFTVMAFLFLFGLSYLLNSTRPEKVLIKLVQRYFRSIDFLEHRQAPMGSGIMALIQQWRFNFHRYEIKTIPGKITAWGRGINHELFPGNSQEDVQRLVNCLAMLSLRVESLLKDGKGTIADLRKQLDDLTPDSETYFFLLGGLRGFSEASAAYKRIADKIDWTQWREERFS